jgi:hypothetical protein
VAKVANSSVLQDTTSSWQISAANLEAIYVNRRSLEQTHASTSQPYRAGAIR